MNIILNIWIRGIITVGLLYLMVYPFKILQNEGAIFLYAVFGQSLFIIVFMVPLWVFGWPKDICIDEVYETRWDCFTMQGEPA
jgi:hypothetical protein